MSSESKNRGVTFLTGALLITFVVGSWADEILYRGPWTRNEEKLEGGYRFSLIQEKEKGKASGWVLQVRRGEEIQRQEIVKDQPNVFRFGREALEIRNKNLVDLKNERWDMVRDGSSEGDFVFVRKTPETYLRHHRGTLHGRESVVLENSFLRLKLLPSNKGGLIEILDKRSGKDFVYLPSPKEAGSDYGNSGLVDLLGGLTDYAAEKYRVKVTEDGRWLSLDLESRRENKLLVQRKVRLHEEGSFFDLTSSLKVVGGPPVRRLMRHKMSLCFSDLHRSECYFPGENGRVVRRRFVEMGKLGDRDFPACPWIVSRDHENRSALVAVYEVDDLFDRMYMYFAPGFFCLESFMKYRTLKAGDSLMLKARYFLMQGTEHVSQVNPQGVIGVRGTKPGFSKGEEVRLSVELGLCHGRPLTIELEVRDQQGEVAYTGRRDEWFYTGVVRRVPFVWRRPGGEGTYQVVARARDAQDRLAIEARGSFSIFDQSNEKFVEYEEELEAKSRELRKSKDALPQLFELEKTRAMIRRLVKKGKSREAEAMYEEALRAHR